MVIELLSYATDLLMAFQNFRYGVKLITYLCALNAFHFSPSPKYILRGQQLY